jgi:hypothetical protein
MEQGETKRVTVQVSPANQLVVEDIMAAAKNAFVFAIPALIVFLTALQTGMPVKDALYSVYPWILSTAIDVLKKWKEVKYY